MLVDGFGRQIRYLRISLTDKCNLRCRYCVPEEGVVIKPHIDLLTLEEVERTAAVLTGLGIEKIRFTGGEPLVRRGAVSVIRSVASLPAKPSVGLTTNGVLLNENLHDLMSCGLSGINISLDTLRDDVYGKITGFPVLPQVLSAVHACIDSGITLKINAVPMKGINEEDIPALAQFSRDNDMAVRFIELMPMGCASAFTGIPNDEVMKMLCDRFGSPAALTAVPEDGPASYVRFQGFKGRVGFISPLTHRFCGSCDRIRLTCDGRLKLCLASPVSLDLRSLLRSGASDEDIAAAVAGALKDKPAGHEFINKKCDQNMIGIGG